MIRLGDNQLNFEGENNKTAVLSINNLLEFDRFQIMGPGNERTRLTFDTTYTQLAGTPTNVVPTGGDANNWAGKVWEGTAKGKFSARYEDGSFSVTGTMDSAVAVEGRPGHIGHERNGVFANLTHH